MTKNEFIEHYHPHHYGGLKQASLDLFEEIEETFNEDLDVETIISSISYKISTALEVYSDELRDRDWLVDMYNDLKKLDLN